MNDIISKAYNHYNCKVKKGILMHYVKCLLPIWESSLRIDSLSCMQNNDGRNTSFTKWDDSDVFFLL